MAESLWRRVFGHRFAPALALPRVLAVTASPLDDEAYRYLRNKGEWDLITVPTVQQALGLLKIEKVPVVLLDRDLEEQDWRHVLSAMVRTSPGTCFLLTSRVADEYLWKEFVRHGGYDVVSKPLNGEVLEQTLRKAWRYWSARGAGVTGLPRFS